MNKEHMMMEVKTAPKAKTLDQKDIFKAIHRSQHCQRNWDLEKSIPEQDIDLILESVTQCPSKQNQSFYKVHVLSDRDIIEQVHANTQGFGLSDGTVTTNAQTLANMVLVFESNMTQDQIITAYANRLITQHGASIEDMKNTNWSNHEFDQSILESCKNELAKDEHMAVGLAAGYCNVTASLLGYSTGCCACFNPQDIQNVLGLAGAPLLIMGVGIAGSQNRRVHHLDNTIKFPTKSKETIEVIYH